MENKIENLAELLSSIFNKVWLELDANISFTVVILVITAGYLIRWLKVLPKWSNTLKIALIGLIVSGIYTYAEGLKFTVWLVSFFCAFGFHALLLKKLVDEKINPKKEK